MAVLFVLYAVRDLVTNIFLVVARKISRPHLGYFLC